jgi:hypothetical protein
VLGVGVVGEGLGVAGVLGGTRGRRRGEEELRLARCLSCPSRRDRALGRVVVIGGRSYYPFFGLQLSRLTGSSPVVEFQSGSPGLTAWSPPAGGARVVTAAMARGEEEKRSEHRSPSDEI